MSCGRTVIFAHDVHEGFERNEQTVEVEGDLKDELYNG